MNARHYTAFGMLGAAVRIFSILLFILASKQFLGMKYNYYLYVALPVVISQLLYALYAYNYTKHQRYGRFVNTLSKQFFVLSLVVCLITLFDMDMVIFAPVQGVYGIVFTALIWNISGYVHNNVQKRGKINIAKGFLILSVPAFVLAVPLYYAGQEDWMQLCFSAGYCFLFVSLSVLYSLLKYRKKDKAKELKEKVPEA